MPVLTNNQITMKTSKMYSTKTSKMYLLKQLQQHNIDSCMTEIIGGIETLSELKLTLVDYANKFYHIRSSQQNNQVQWYLGDRFYYGKTDVNEYITAIHKIAEITNYDLYSKQGWWFIKSY